MSSGKCRPFCLGLNVLTHWGRVTHICVSKLTIIGSNNGLSPGRRQAIIWTSAGILLIWPLRTNFSDILIEIHTFSFKKVHLKISSGKWRPFCLGLNVLISLQWRNDMGAIFLLMNFYAGNLPVTYNFFWLTSLVKYMDVSCCTTEIYIYIDSISSGIYYLDTGQIRRFQTSLRCHRQS